MTKQSRVVEDDSLEYDPANAAAWETFNEYMPAETRETLYHYTSLAGLLGIVCTGAIWATDTAYLNDTTEARYARDVIEAVQRATCRRTTSSVGELLDATRRGWLLGTAHSHMYVASFSEVGDSLSQWVAYTPAGAGVAIGTKEYLLDPRSMVRRVLYEPKRQREFLTKIYAIYRHALTEACRNRDKTRVERLTRMLGIILHQALFCFKNPSFAAEREWRLMQLWSERSVEVVPSFRATPRALVPYVTVPLQHPAAADGIIGITEIVIGPGLDYSLNESAIRRLLRGRARRLKVKASRVPFRSLS